MRPEFLKGTRAVPKYQTKYTKYTQDMTSKARIENYDWMTPPPRYQRYLGFRRFGSLDQIRYPVPNLEYDVGLSVPTRAVEDDQIGGYDIRFKQLGQDANLLYERLAIAGLANGASTVCFDGSNFFSNSNTGHNQGGVGSAGPALPSGFTGGGNSIAFSAASGDGAGPFKAVFMLTYEEPLPVFVQRRKGPTFDTDSGQPSSRKAKQVDYWSDLETAVGYGWWWDAVLLTVTNTPTLTEIFTCIDVVMKQFWSFTLPASSPTDPALYVHQGLQFKPDVAMVLSGVGLGRLFQHAMTEERIGVSVAGSTGGITNNIFKGTFDVDVSPYLV